MARKKIKLLFVEDEPNLVRLVKHRLETENYSVSVAADGREALRKVKSVKPDLIILDILLPKLSGYDVCIKLKGDKKTAAIPILMFTAKAQEKDVRLGLEAGADAYVKKPFKPKDLLEQIHTLLKK